MATVTKTSGDFKPVMNQDQPSYTFTAINAVTSGATVNVQGPKLDFGTITFTGNATVSGAELLAAIESIQQKATIAIYEFTTVGANSATLGLAVYPTGAWDFTNGGDLDVAVTAAVGYAVTTAATATFTN